MRSQPSAMPRFSAAMVGCLINVSMRRTDSWWRFSISAWMGLRSGAVAANAAVVAAAPTRNVRRSMVVSLLMVGLLWGDYDSGVGWSSNGTSRPEGRQQPIMAAHKEVSNQGLVNTKLCGDADFLLEPRYCFAEALFQADFRG